MRGSTFSPWIHPRLMGVWLLIAVSSNAGAAAGLSWDTCTPLPDEVGFAGSFAGASRGVLIVAGGANFPDLPPWKGGRKVWHDRIFVLREPSAAWETAGKLPSPSAYGASVAVGGDFVIIGGGDAVQHTSEVWLVRWTGSEVAFEAWPTLPIRLANVAGVLVGRTLYAAGGLSAPDATRAENVLLALDLDRLQNGWRQCPPCPGGERFHAVAAAHQGRFYLFGGARLRADANGGTRRELLRDAWCYAADQGWTRLSDLPRPVVAAPTPAPSIRQSIFLLGGDDGSQMTVSPDAQRGFERSILEYQPGLDIWREAGELPFALVTTPVAAWGERLVVPGGESRPGRRSTQVWISGPLN